MADNSNQPASRLSTISAAYRDENLVRNKCCNGYVCGNEYCAGSKDVISDGDCRGRDPKDAGGTIGTNIDIENRNCAFAMNTSSPTKRRYKPGNEYCSATA